MPSSIMTTVGKHQAVSSDIRCDPHKLRKPLIGEDSLALPAANRAIAGMLPRFATRKRAQPWTFPEK